MDLAAAQIATGLLVGLAIGLTGIGGGALLTPIVVLLLGVPPATAVSSDVVVSLAVKPVGSAVHLRHGTARLDITKWLVAGSVPAAFGGVLILRLLGDRFSGALRPMLGLALVVASAALLARILVVRRNARVAVADASPASPVRPLPTLLVGAVGGLLVGLTSVGAGSLMLVLLTVLYPNLSSAQLVGTDLVQAVPLVGSAAIGHLLFGHVHFALVTWLVIGALPGVYVGARMSSRAPDRIVRPILATLLAFSGLKLVGVA